MVVCVLHASLFPWGVLTEGIVRPVFRIGTVAGWLAIARIIFDSHLVRIRASCSLVRPLLKVTKEPGFVNALAGPFRRVTQ
jgi:hypothetical protein